MIKKRTKIVGHISGAVGPKGDNGFSPIITTSETQDGYRRVCKEGPVLKKEEIVW